MIHTIQLYLMVSDCSKNEWNFKMLIFCAKKSGVGEMGGWVDGLMDGWMG